VSEDDRLAGREPGLDCGAMDWRSLWKTGSFLILQRLAYHDRAGSGFLWNRLPPNSWSHR